MAARKFRVVVYIHQRHGQAVKLFFIRHQLRRELLAQGAFSAGEQHEAGQRIQIPGPGSVGTKGFGDGLHRRRRHFAHGRHTEALEVGGVGGGRAELRRAIGTSRGTQTADLRRDIRRFDEDRYPGNAVGDDESRARRIGLVGIVTLPSAVAETGRQQFRLGPEAHGHACAPRPVYRGAATGTPKHRHRVSAAHRRSRAAASG